MESEYTCQQCNKKYRSEKKVSINECDNCGIRYCENCNISNYNCGMCGIDYCDVCKLDICSICKIDDEYINCPNPACNIIRKVDNDGICDHCLMDHIQDGNIYLCKRHDYIYSKNIDKHPTCEVEISREKIMNILQNEYEKKINEEIEENNKNLEKEEDYYDEIEKKYKNDNDDKDDNDQQNNI